MGVTSENSLLSRGFSWQKTILLLIFGMACLGLDTTLPVAITPILGLCALIWIATLESPKTVGGAAAILLVFVVLSLVGRPWESLVARSLSFLVGGSLAVGYSHHRLTSEENVSSMMDIIRALPMAVVAADVTGAIVAASDQANTLVGETYRPNGERFRSLTGHAFSDVFLGNLPPGQAMKTYIDWFMSDGIRQTSLTVRGGQSFQLASRIVTSGTGRHRVLLAVIMESHLPTHEHSTGL